MSGSQARAGCLGAGRAGGGRGEDGVDVASGKYHQAVKPSACAHLKTVPDRALVLRDKRRDEERPARPQSARQSSGTARVQRAGPGQTLHKCQGGGPSQGARRKQNSLAELEHLIECLADNSCTRKQKCRTGPLWTRHRFFRQMVYRREDHYRSRGDSRRAIYLRRLMARIDLKDTWGLIPVRSRPAIQAQILAETIAPRQKATASAGASRPPAAGKVSSSATIGAHSRRTHPTRHPTPAWSSSIDCTEFKDPSRYAGIRPYWDRDSDERRLTAL